MDVKEEDNQMLKKRAIRCRGRVQTIKEEQGNRGGRVGQTVAEQEHKQTLKKRATRCR